MPKPNPKPRHPHKAYRLLEALRRIRNPADEQRIKQLSDEIHEYWGRYLALPEVERQIDLAMDALVAKVRKAKCNQAS